MRGVCFSKQGLQIRSSSVKLAPKQQTHWSSTRLRSKAIDASVLASPPRIHHVVRRCQTLLWRCGRKQRFLFFFFCVDSLYFVSADATSASMRPWTVLALRAPACLARELALLASAASGLKLKRSMCRVAHRAITAGVLHAVHVFRCA